VVEEEGPCDAKEPQGGELEGPLPNPTPEQTIPSEGLPEEGQEENA